VLCSCSREQQHSSSVPDTASLALAHAAAMSTGKLKPQYNRVRTRCVLAAAAAAARTNAC
jgi:hypothetical protein